MSVDVNDPKVRLRLAREALAEAGLGHLAKRCHKARHGGYIALPKYSHMDRATCNRVLEVIAELPHPPGTWTQAFADDEWWEYFSAPWWRWWSTRYPSHRYAGVLARRAR